MNKKKKKRGFDSYVLLDNIVWIILIVAIIVMGCFKRSFFSLGILTNILTQSTVLGVLALAVSMAIILGDINLSTVGIAGFSSLIGVTLMQKAGFPIIISILVILLVGTGIGFITGYMIAKWKANALILTLAINTVLQGALLAITEGRTLSNLPDAYKFMSQGKIGSFPVLPLVLFAVCIVFYILWEKTIYGRSLFAVGGNARSAYIAGINVDWVRIAAFTISGLLAGLAGYLLSAYQGSVTASFGNSYEMQCISAAVIGGVSLSGGKGKVVGVLGGTLMLTTVQVGLNILGIKSTMVSMVGGLMVLAAVIIDAIKNLRMSKM